MSWGISYSDHVSVTVTLLLLLLLPLLQLMLSYGAALQSASQRVAETADAATCNRWCGDQGVKGPLNFGLSKIVGKSSSCLKIIVQKCKD